MALNQNFDELKPGYQIVGEDGFLMQEMLHQIENACENSLGDVNKAVFDDDNFNAESIILSCQQLPLMAKKRLVVVKNILKAKDAEIKKLIEYCKMPNDDVVLVFYEVPNLNVFGKLPLEKLQCKKLGNAELKKIINEEFAKYNKTISAEAINLLIEYTSKDILRIKNEIFKLAFVGTTEISEEDIKNNVKQNDDYSVFEISSALSSGNADKSINLMKKMLNNMEFPVILALISSHFRRMMYVCLSDYSNAELGEYLGVKEFAIANIRSRAKAIKPLQIVKINELILQTDYSIKSGKMSVDNAMYYLVFGITEIIKGERND